MTNRTRSYANICIGRVTYPDVSSKGPNPFYFEVAAAVGIPVSDSRSIIRGRLLAMGLWYAMTLFIGHALASAYAGYVGGDLNAGVFTLVRFVPVTDLPVYLVNRRRKALIRRWSSRPHPVHRYRGVPLRDLARKREQLVAGYFEIRATEANDGYLLGVRLPL